MSLESPEKYIRSIEEKEAIKEIVARVIDMHCQAAKNYLPDGKLRDQIIKFYSDADRLSNELANVFKGMNEQGVKNWIEEREKITNNKDLFIEFANTKSFATNLQERRDFESTKIETN